MAFHPFKHFRKHQKVYLAGLTIMTMIIFVFSFGAADPFQSALRWIGLTSHHGDPVLKLYGKTLYTDDLDKVRWQRQLASEFLLYGSTSPLSRSLDGILKRVQNEKRGNENIPSPLQLAAGVVNNLNNPFMMQTKTREEIHQLVMNGLRSVQNQFDNPDVQSNPELFRDLDTIATWLAFQAWFSNPQRPPQEYYFGGSPAMPDLLDFLVWKRQADQLGIVLTPADVCRAVNRAAGNDEFLKPDVNFDNNEQVAVFLNSSQKVHKNLTSRDLLNALTDEYRVSLAKEAILGSSSGVRSYRNDLDGIHHSPAIATPDEFYKYYQEQRTTLAVSMLPIAVKDFVSKVQAAPKEQDLRNLYERYKEEEPAAARRQPGFKEPRRVKVQYFSYRTNGPFARKQAAQMLELLPLFRLGVPVAPFAAGGGLAWGASLAVPADLDTAIRAQYENYRREEAGRVVKFDKDDANIFQGASRFGLGFDLNAQQALAAQAPAATVGQLLGLAGTGATPLAAPVTWMGTNDLSERATLTLYSSSVLAGASSSPLTALTLPTRYLHSVRPLEEVRGQMVERIETNLAARLMESHVLAVRKEIDKLLASRDEAKLNEYLKKAVAENGLDNFHSMTKTQTRQEMLDDLDPALKALRTAYEQSMEDPFNPFAFFRRQPRPDFVSAMFHNFVVLEKDEPTRSIKPFKSLFEDSSWVFWRSEDKPAHVRPFNEVRAQVKDAWYLEQARKLAREEARRIDDELKKQRLAPADAVKFLREQKQGEVFELTNVAHLQSKVANVLAGHKFSASDFQPYVVPKDLIAYPPDNFVAQLLKLKERGDSLVLADQPVRHFYVAVLMEKPQVPERQEFYSIYNSRGADNILWTQMIDARQRKYAEKVIKQLRAEATKDLEGGEYIIPEKVRSRGESGGSESTE
jgi:hypothetical protein